jgi:hypothetical protein
MLLDVVVKRRPPHSTMWVGPRACDEPAVPAQQRLGLHEEARPAGSGQCPADGAKKGAVGGLEPGSRDSATQHRELAAQHQDLQILGGLVVRQHTSSWMERQSIR